MSGSVISFANPANWRRTATGPWTNQELAELYRITSILGQAGMPVGTDSGQSDEGDPWFVFYHLDSGDVIAHFARIDGQFIAAAGPNTLRGRDFRDLVDQIVASQPLVFPQARPAKGSNVTKLYMHPIVVLTAFVAAALLHSRKSLAADATDGGDAGDQDSRGRAASEATTLTGLSGANAPMTSGFVTQTMHLASALALIVATVKADSLLPSGSTEEEALALLGDGTDAPLLLSSDSVTDHDLDTAPTQTAAADAPSARPGHGEADAAPVITMMTADSSSSIVITPAQGSAAPSGVTHAATAQTVAMAIDHASVPVHTPHPLQGVSAERAPETASLTLAAAPATTATLANPTAAGETAINVSVPEGGANALALKATDPRPSSATSESVPSLVVTVSDENHLSVVFVPAATKDGLLTLSPGISLASAVPAPKGSGSSVSTATVSDYKASLSLASVSSGKVGTSTTSVDGRDHSDSLTLTLANAQGSSLIVGDKGASSGSSLSQGTLLQDNGSKDLAETETATLTTGDFSDSSRADASLATGTGAASADLSATFPSLTLGGTSRSLHLGEGRDVIYFTGGQTTLYGYTPREDTILVAPDILKGGEFASYGNDGTITINFGEGSTITLLGVRLDDLVAAA